MEPIPADAELVLLVRSGDRAAGDLLVRRHQGLVWRAIRGLRNVSPSVEYDDLAQAGRLAILQSCKQWEPGKGTKFSSYAYQSIWWAVVGESNKQERQALPCQEGSEGLLAEVAARPELPEVDLSGLHPRRRVLISLVFGINGGQERTVEVAGRMLGLNRREANREYELALDELRSAG